LRDERGLFEFLVLEGAQAGLSWDLVLSRREAYREAFDGFDPARVARYTARRVEALLGNPGLIRNRLKIASAVTNAAAFLRVQDECGGFAAYQWGFVGDAPRQNAWRTPAEVPARTAESDAFSRDLIRRGFRFVGSTIVYAHMQAVGMVNDHTVDCRRHAELGGRAPSRRRGG
ncbi:MAG: DNA-3-methyladenine glycosylase I, partial [Candidatus Krumholzibacteriia bacterium]